jgi:AraC-like DNA-binding protein
MMLQFPKDLIQTHLSVKIKNTEMYGVCFNSLSAKNADALQTSHCMEIALAGKAMIRSGKEIYELAAGRLQFRKRGNYQFTFPENYQSLLFFLENEFIEEFLKLHIFSYPDSKYLYTKQHLYVTDILPFHFKTNDAIIENINQAITTITTHPPYSSCQIKLSAHMILLQMLSMDPENNFVQFLRYLITDRKVELVWFMENNFKKHLSLKDLARLSGRSESTFKKDFKAAFGTSPFRWILQRRLQYAEFLLKSATSNVSEIADESGFKNLSHFSRTYKKVFGIAPSETKSF